MREAVHTSLFRSVRSDIHPAFSGCRDAPRSLVYGLAFHSIIMTAHNDLFHQLGDGSPDGHDHCVPKREDYIAVCNTAHVLIELVACSVLVALWRPSVSVRNVCLVRLILINPPVPPTLPAHGRLARCSHPRGLFQEQQGRLDCPPAARPTA